MRTVCLIVAVFHAVTALAQDTIPAPDGQQGNIRVKGDVKAAYTANGGIRELAEFVVRFAVPHGIEPPSEQIVIDFDAVPPVPCIIVAIPAGAFVPTNNAFRLISDDPKLSGVQVLQVDEFGNLVADLTGNVLSLQARLRKVEDEEGAWRLVIEARSEAADDNPLWLPAGESIGTNLSIGNAALESVARRAEFVQIVQPPTAQPNAFADLTIRGEVKVGYPDNGGLREVVEINTRFALGLSDGIDPLSEALSIDFAAVPPTPCNIVAIPAGAFVPTNNGYRLISDDPKISGVQYLLTDAQGQLLEDLTGNIRRFDAVLRQNDDGSWRLRIEAVSRTVGEANWLPILSPGANVSFGNDAGSTLTRRVEFVHRTEPPDA